MKVERVVVDTNVLISAALSPDSTPAQLVSLILSEYRLLFSHQTFAEFETRLWRPKFDRYVPPPTRRQLLHDFAAVADWVVLGEDLPSYCRDADDDKFIHTALAGGASCLVSGDSDLQVLSAINGVLIGSPAWALEKYGRRV